MGSQGKATEKVYREINVNQECIVIESVRDLDEFLKKETFRKFHSLPQERCEDRSLLYSNYFEPTSSPSSSPESSLEDCLGSSRPFVEKDVNQETKRSLLLYYNMIIAPVADLLEEPEILLFLTAPYTKFHLRLCLMKLESIYQRLSGSASFLL